MLAIAGFAFLAVFSYLHFGIKRINNMKPKFKKELLAFTKYSLIGGILSAITGIVSLFFYPLSQQMFGIFFVLICWFFPVGSLIIGNYVTEVGKNK